MFYQVSFGKNTRTYLYKSNIIEGKEGMAVIVPTGKNGNKEGIIVDILSSIPENISFTENDIKEIVCRSYAEIGDAMVIKYLVSLVALFKKGNISRMKFTEIAEGFTSLNRLVIEKKWLNQVLYSDIPDMHLFYVLEPGG